MNGNSLVLINSVSNHTGLFTRNIVLPTSSNVSCTAASSAFMHANLDVGNAALKQALNFGLHLYVKS